MSNGREIRWDRNRNQHNGQLSFIGRDDGGKDVLEVYQCADGSWRIWFEHGTSTSECDTRQRNINSLREAKTEAERWYREWARDWLPK